MLIKDILPVEALREYVQCFRIVHFTFRDSKEYPMKAYSPKPEICLYFYLRDKEDIELIHTTREAYPVRIGLVGQQTSLTKRYPGKNFLNFQIVFHPTGFFRLTGVPSYEFTDKFVDAESVFPSTIRAVHDKLQHAMSMTDMLQTATDFVDSLVAKSKENVHRIDALSGLMMRSYHLSVEWLAYESCLSEKQFRRKFYERTGIKPKTFSRIARLSKAVNMKNARPDWDWLKVAVECEYHDYQHLAKDFYNLTGYSPPEIYSMEQKSPEQMLGLGAEIYQSRLDL